MESEKKYICFFFISEKQMPTAYAVAHTADAVGTPIRVDKNWSSLRFLSWWAYSMSDQFSVQASFQPKSQRVAYLDSLDSRLSGSFVCKRTRTSFSGKDAISLLKVSIRGGVLAATLLQTYADES